MAKQAIINSGGSPDNLKEGSDKINSNFDELYADKADNADVMLLDGTQAMTGELDSDVGTFNSGVAAGSTAYTLDTTNSMTADLIDIQNQSTSKFTIDWVGDVVAEGAITGQGTLTLDTTQMVYNGHDNGFTQSLFFGNGGGSLSHTTGSEGYNNNGVGINSLLNVTTGLSNNAMGARSLLALTTGTKNTAVGQTALSYTQTDSDNTAIGFNALADDRGGAGNTGIGSNSLRYNSTADYNSAIGTYSLFNNLTGGYNVAIGHRSGFTNTAGVDNTFIGERSGYSATGSSNVFIGHDAGYNETGSNKLYISNSNTSSPLIHGDFNSSVLTLNADVIIPSPTVPSSASDTGVAGTIAWDASYIYVCTATDTWKRVAIATW